MFSFCWECDWFAWFVADYQYTSVEVLRKLYSIGSFELLYRVALAGMGHFFRNPEKCDYLSSHLHQNETR